MAQTPDAQDLNATLTEAAPADNTLEKFKKLVRKAIFLTADESVYFKAIPDEKWKRIFEVNFNGNFAYAERVIFKKFAEIKKTDMARVDAEKSKIHNLERAAKMLNSAIDNKEPVLFITDIDNDGSFAQSIVYEFLRADPSAGATTHVEYTQVVNGNAARGFTVDHLDKLVSMHAIDTDLPFLVVTADNGINSRDEQEKIQARFPQAKLLVTDHHKPDEAMKVIEDAQTVIFNPWHHASDFYRKFNISGAATLGVLLRRVLDKRLGAPELALAERHLENITTLSRVANLLDYVHSDPMDKPEKDYTVTKFLQLQGLMNVNNSLSRIILDGIPQSVRDELKKTVPGLDESVLDSEARNIETQNQIARVLLKLHDENRGKDLPADDFGKKMLAEMARPENFSGAELFVNRNFIEQLRPPIFSLSVDEKKSAFMAKLCEAMVGVYESIRESERKLSAELRKGQAMERVSLPHSAIGYANPGVLKTFNRKFLGKAYNDENPGFLAIIDSAVDGVVRCSGSMRSLYDFSDILPDQEKSNLEFELGVKISTPGHERAAGFIIESTNEQELITREKISAINEAINGRVAALRAKDASTVEPQLLTDLSAIGLIDRINQVVRGSISNFERVVPLLKLTPDTIWTDSYSTQQYTMADIAQTKRFGYLSIKTNFKEGAVIVPVELIRRVVENNFQDYLAINYMDGGVFMAERVVPFQSVPLIRDLRGDNAKGALIDKVFSSDFKESNVISLNREQIKDNPFFKYNDFGRADFNLFERMVIGILDTTRLNSEPIDTLAVFDVEANGFGNGKLMNFGAMNYAIAPDVGVHADIADFRSRLFQNQRGHEFLLTPEQIEALVPVASENKLGVPVATRRRLLMKRFAAPGEHITYDVYYDYPDSARKDTATAGLGPIAYVNNHAILNGAVVYNRAIQAEMLAYLIKDSDFKVPQEMTNLTGITQAHLDAYGKPTAEADASIAAYYKNKKTLFGAHNTPYDARILRANTPLTYATLLKNAIYDSALFCKEDKLAYDDVKLTSFHDIDDLPDNVYFYDNPHSDFSLTDFLADESVDRYYPDRTGNFLLGREKGAYSFIDKVKHDSIQLRLNDPADAGETPDADADPVDSGHQSVSISHRSEGLNDPADAGETPDADADPVDSGHQSVLISHRSEGQSIPGSSVKYGVEKLSEQWMTHALLLSEEPFDIKHIDLSTPQYAELAAFKSQMVFFQDNYLFDASPGSNIDDFCAEAFIGVDGAPSKETLEVFVKEFLEINHSIQKKFTDSWMYKSVLGVMEPQSSADLNKDNYNLIHFQTQVPKDTIRDIFIEAMSFKAKYGVERILQHEGHVNGPWEGDHKGDVAFEDKLTLSLLARRMYNPYSRDLSAAIERFGQSARKAKLAFDLSDNLSDGAAHDSYSYRQGLLYRREDSSAMISGIQAKEARLGEAQDAHVIKLKLGNEVLPSENSVCAIARQGVALSRDDIVRDAKMLDFIIVNEQTRSSLDRILDIKTRDEILMLLEANDKISLRHKADLAERYRFVEINRRDLQLKKLLATSISTSEGKPPKRAPKIESFSDVSAQDLDIVEKILRAQAGMHPQGALDTHFERALDLLDAIRAKRVPTSLEAALARPDTDGFATFQATRDHNFLKEVDIHRLDPVNTLLFKHPSLRMGNAFIQEQIDANRPAPTAPARPSPIGKPKRGRRMG